MLLWNVSISNTGTADLIISDITFTPDIDLTCTILFPVVVQIGKNVQLPIEYSPTAFGPLDAVATIFSNDPIHPNEPLTITGHGVYSEPTEDVAYTLPYDCPGTGAK